MTPRQTGDVELEVAWKCRFQVGPSLAGLAWECICVGSPSGRRVGIAPGVLQPEGKPTFWGIG